MAIKETCYFWICRSWPGELTSVELVFPFPGTWMPVGYLLGPGAQKYLTLLKRVPTSLSGLYRRLFRHRRYLFVIFLLIYLSCSCLTVLGLVSVLWLLLVTQEEGPSTRRNPLCECLLGSRGTGVVSFVGKRGLFPRAQKPSRLVWQQLSNSGTQIHQDKNTKQTVGGLICFDTP